MSGKFPAVAIVSKGERCAASKKLDGQRLLAADAPLLPLKNCTMPEQCGCSYLKFADRRKGDEDRRFGVFSHRALYYGGPEKRGTGGRRKDD